MAFKAVRLQGSGLRRRMIHSHQGINVIFTERKYFACINKGFSIIKKSYNLGVKYSLKAHGAVCDCRVHGDKTADRKARRAVTLIKVTDRADSLV